MVIVSDTSAISNLFKIGQLELLREVFGQIVLPTTVMQELLELEKRGVDLTEIKTAKWIEVVAVKNDAFADSLQKFMLDAGESQAIALAIELAADYLIMDEALGRKVAESQGLRVIGVLGVLRDAKRLGLVGAVKPIMDELRTVARFRISESLYNLILTETGELGN